MVGWAGIINYQFVVGAGLGWAGLGWAGGGERLRLSPGRRMLRPGWWSWPLVPAPPSTGDHVPPTHQISTPGYIHISSIYRPFSVVP